MQEESLWSQLERREQRLARNSVSSYLALSGSVQSNYNKVLPGVVATGRLFRTEGLALDLLKQGGKTEGRKENGLT